MGRMHANVYKQITEAQLVGCVDLNPESADKFGSDFGIPAFHSLEDALAKVQCEVIDICLPTDLHKEWTVKAAGLGKNVFCEKPMARSLEEADAMINACKSAGVSLFVGHCIRFWPEYVYLKKLVEDKTLGNLLSINLTRYGAFPKWASEKWTSSEQRAGGGVLDMHIHDTDFIHYLLGKPDSMVSFGTIDDRGPGHVFTTMKYGKIVAHLEGGWNFPQGTPFKHAFRAVFEKGAAIMDAGPLTIYEEGKENFTPSFEKMSAEGGGNISDLGGYYHEIKYFVDRVSKGLPLETVTPESSRQSLETVLEEIRQIEAHQ